MKGEPKVLEQLNQALRGELTAINQHFLYAEMLMEGILFLDGTPSMEPMSRRSANPSKR